LQLVRHREERAVTQTAATLVIFNDNLPTPVSVFITIVSNFSLDLAVRLTAERGGL
jgi:hypothetical protein